MRTKNRIDLIGFGGGVPETVTTVTGSRITRLSVR